MFCYTWVQNERELYFLEDNISGMIIGEGCNEEEYIDF